MDDLGFPRTPDRSVKLLGTCVRYLRSIETPIGARGPDFLGGSTTLGSNEKVEMTLSASEWVGQEPLGLICIFCPSSI